MRFSSCEVDQMPKWKSIKIGNIEGAVDLEQVAAVKKAGKNLVHIFLKSGQKLDMVQGEVDEFLLPE